MIVSIIVFRFVLGFIFVRALVAVPCLIVLKVLFSLSLVGRMEGATLEIDVYKRQLPSSFKLFAEVCYALIPVSYTHLDVYKRQIYSLFLKAYDTVEVKEKLNALESLIGSRG